MSDITPNPANLDNAIKHLTSSIERRLAIFGDKDPVVIRKRAQLAVIRTTQARSQRQSVQAAPPMPEVSARDEQSPVEASQ